MLLTFSIFLSNISVFELLAIKYQYVGKTRVKKGYPVLLNQKIELSNY